MNNDFVGRIEVKHSFIRRYDMAKTGCSTVRPTSKNTPSVIQRGLPVLATQGSSSQLNDNYICPRDHFTSMKQRRCLAVCNDLKRLLIIFAYGAITQLLSLEIG